MAQKIIQVDSFTDKPFAGNPAGVCVMTGPAEKEWMQAVAAEMNLSETAFLYPEGSEYNLRWFTPTSEIELCGHATLASAHVLWEEGYLIAGQQARFNTLSGLLTADKRGDIIEMDFPATVVEGAPPIEGLLEAMKVEEIWVGKSHHDYLIEVAEADTVRNASPDFATLTFLKTRGVILTAASDVPEYDFISRFFAPAIGILEDPVTGAAHCALTTYWAGKLGKQEMNAFQASARGGDVKVRLEGDRVVLGGHAVTVIRGELA